MSFPIVHSFMDLRQDRRLALNKNLLEWIRHSAVSVTYKGARCSRFCTPCTRAGEPTQRTTTTCREGHGCNFYECGTHASRPKESSSRALYQTVKEQAQLAEDTSEHLVIFIFGHGQPLHTDRYTVHGFLLSALLRPIIIPQQKRPPYPLILFSKARSSPCQNGIRASQHGGPEVRSHLNEAPEACTTTNTNVTLFTTSCYSQG